MSFGNLIRDYLLYGKGSIKGIYVIGNNVNGKVAYFGGNGFLLGCVQWLGNNGQETSIRSSMNLFNISSLNISPWNYEIGWPSSEL